MIQTAITGKRQIAFRELPDPRAVGDWAVVRVHASALCTEYKAWLAGQKQEITGHEGVGVVVDVAQSGPVKVGDRVVVLPQFSCGRCRLCMGGDYIYCEFSHDFAALHGSMAGAGTFAHYALKPSWLLPKLPDEVSFARATMAIDGVGASFGGLEAIGADSQDTVLITGLGPVGLGAVVNARFRNARVIGVEPAPWRANRALEMGAETVLDPNDPDILQQILGLTGGRGVDCAIDCSGRVSSERLCIDAARRRGRVAFVGECREDLTIRISPDMIRKGLTVVGSWLYNMGDYAKVMKVISQSPLIELLISHELPMSQIQTGFNLLAQGEAAKIVVDPWS